MQGLIDISGLDRIELLRQLWAHQKVAAFFDYAPLEAIPSFDNELAKKMVHQGYLDYFCGRAIKCDLTRDLVDPALYDRNAGQGMFAKIVDKLNMKK